MSLSWLNILLFLFSPLHMPQPHPPFTYPSRIREMQIWAKWSFYIFLSSWNSDTNYLGLFWNVSRAFKESIYQQVSNPSHHRYQQEPSRRLSHSRLNITFHLPSHPIPSHPSSLAQPPSSHLQLQVPSFTQTLLLNSNSILPNINIKTIQYNISEPLSFPNPIPHYHHHKQHMKFLFTLLSLSISRSSPPPNWQK